MKDFESGWKRLTGKINREPLLRDWIPQEFEFQKLDKESCKRPSICTVYVPGLLAFPVHVKQALFPVTEGLEFLPIKVGEDEWLLLNCLNSVKGFDERESQVWRGLEGQIFTVLKLKVTDPKARDLEVFTLSDSNRAQLFARPSFKSRVERLGLEGVEFHCIGEA